VRPGITGLWQISGRSEVQYFERVLFDMRYVCSRNIWRDLRIILLTVPGVLAARGSRQRASSPPPDPLLPRSAPLQTPSSAALEGCFT
jgi:hypothetical protein